jgi:hypothetical protein
MSTKTHRLIMTCTMLLALSGISYGQEAKAFIGIQLDSSPLPELLTKHLGLDPNEGVRILNIAKDSPAKNAGLDRDDLIISFQGKTVTGMDQLVDAVHELPVRGKVTMEAIHLGKHKNVQFETAPTPENPQWIYPSEPQFEVSWGPGRIFRLNPNGGNWIEVPFDNVPNLGDLPMMKRLFAERYLTHHATASGESYSITIEGDPKDPNTPITVQSAQSKYSATIGKIDSLPEQYRAAARESVVNAKKEASQRVRIGKLPEPPNPEAFRKYFDNITLPKFDANQVIEKLQGQIDKLQQRLDQMEKHLDKAPDKSQKSDPASAPSDTPKSSKKAKSFDDEPI